MTKPYRTAADIPFGDGRPIPPPLTDAELALALQAEHELHAKPATNGIKPDHEPEQQPSWQPASLVTLAANPPAPPTIAGLLYPGKRTVLSGETESMKTWLALILCKAELDIGIPVGWVDLDAMGPGALLERLQLLGVQDDVIDENFIYYEPDRPLDERHTEPVAALLAARGARLCVIDAFNPILGMHGLDPNSTIDVEKFWQLYADPLAEAGVAPTLLDHVTKNAETRGKYAYGSERKASGAIVHLGFKLLEPLTKGGIGKSLLTVHKDRPGYLPRPAIGRLILDATGDRITYRLEPDKSHDPDGGFRPTVLMEKVSRHLEQQTEPISKNQVESDVVGNAKAKRTALQLLTEDGYVRQQTGPNRAIHITSIRPYREAEEPANPGSSSVRPQFVLDLRSEPVRPFVLSLREDEDDPKTLTNSSNVRPRPDGEPIPEYDFPPLATDLDDYPEAQPDYDPNE